jgi:hypothetical protein
MGGGRDRVSPRSVSAWLGRPATLLLLAASLTSAAVILYFERDITFRLDEWEFLIGRPGFTADSIFLPHNEHIVVGPVLVYKALIALFGTASPRPFQIVSTATFIASVGLMYWWIQRRVGEWLALAAALPILFIGAAGEDLLWPFQIGFFVAMCCGLGMLLALDRHDPLGDKLACALLFGALVFSTLGLSFAVAAAVAVMIGPHRLRRAFIVVIPVALYGIWWLRWGHLAENSFSLHNVARSPVYVFDGFASSLSSLLGLATSRDEMALTSLDWGRVLFVGALLLAGLRLRRLGSIRPWFWVVTALAVSFWFLAALNAGPDRPPTSGRYQYMGAVFILLVAAELLRGVKLSHRALAAVFAVCGLIVLSSGSYLHQLALNGQVTGNVVRADLAAVEIARDTVDPGFLPDASFSGTGDVYIPAGLYLAFADDSGSPAFDQAELAAAPEYARAFADRVLARAERLEVDYGTAAATGSCRELDAGDATIAELGPGEVVVRPVAGADVRLALRRFAAASFPVSAGQVAAGQDASIAIPADRSGVPWQLQIAGHGRVSVCEGAAS